MLTEHCCIIAIVLWRREATNRSNSNIATGCQCDPRGLLVHDHTHERFWVSASSSVKSLADVESQWAPLSQNGNEFSGVAAGFLGVLPIITGNCSHIAKIGGDDANGVKRWRVFRGMRVRSLLKE